MSDNINPTFIENMLKKSWSKVPEIARKEWDYLGQVKHLNGIQSTCKIHEYLIYNSIAFYNFKTNEILHTHTGHIKYYLYDKGKAREKIVQQNPKGDGTSQEVNIKMLNKISNFVTSVEKKHITNDVSVHDIKFLCKYRCLLKDIIILEQHKLEEVLYKIDYLVTNFYNINYCCEHNDFYLSPFKQSDFRPKCKDCHYKGPEKCLLKMKK